MGLALTHDSARKLSNSLRRKLIRDFDMVAAKSEEAAENREQELS